MRKKELSEFLEDAFSFCVQKLHIDVFERQPLHGRACMSFFNQRHKRPARLDDRVTQPRRHFIAVPGRAGRGIRAAAGGQNDLVCRKHARLCTNACDRAVFRRNFQRPLPLDFYARLL